MVQVIITAFPGCLVWPDLANCKNTEHIKHVIYVQWINKQLSSIQGKKHCCETPAQILHSSPLKT